MDNLARSIVRQDITDMSVAGANLVDKLDTILEDN